MEMEMDGTATPPQLRCVWETHTLAYFSFGHIFLEKREKQEKHRSLLDSDYHDGNVAKDSPKEDNEQTLTTTSG